MTRPKPAATRTGHASTTPTINRSAVAVLTPDPPADLGGIGQDLWTILWDLGSGVYQTTDQWAISRWCSLQERRQELLAVVAAEGLMTVGSTGQPVVHPAIRMVDTIEGRLPNLEASLGLTPESRLRLGITAVEHMSKLDAFLEGGSSAA